MKKTTILSYTLLLMTITFFSCEEQDGTTSDQLTSKSVADLDLEAEAAVASGYEDVDMVSEAGFDVLEIDANANSRLVRNRFRRMRRDLVLECATVDKDTVNKVITIDYGDGCTGPHGVVRKGKVIVTYSGNRHETGATRTVTLEDFYVDSLHIEGTRTFENLTESDSSDRMVKVTMEGGKVTFPDGTYITRDAEHIRTRVQGEVEEEDYAVLSGEASGLKRDGAAYSVTITEDLMFKRACWPANHGVAVQGVIEIVNGDKQAVVDYGDGTCDKEVEVTVDGETTTKTIEPRGRRGRR